MNDHGDMGRMVSSYTGLLCVVTHNLHGTSIELGESASTLMYCEDKMENEAALITTLDKATNINFKNGKLVLSHGTSSTSFTPNLAPSTGNSAK